MSRDALVTLMLEFVRSRSNPTPIPLERRAEKSVRVSPYSEEDVLKKPPREPSISTDKESEG